MFVATIAVMMWAARVEFQYQAVLPRRADPTNGSLYPLNVHGIVVYQTKDQRDRLNRLWHSSMVMLFVSALMAATSIKLERRSA